MCICMWGSVFGTFFHNFLAFNCGKLHNDKAGEVPPRAQTNSANFVVASVVVVYDSACQERKGLISFTSGKGFLLRIKAMLSIIDNKNFNKNFHHVP